MKTIALLASAVVAETYVSCIGHSEGGQECETQNEDSDSPQIDRTFGNQVRDMLTAMVCPDGAYSPKDVCQETTNNKGQVKGFYDKIWGTVFNYGCNCNQENFRRHYTNPDTGNSWFSVYPGSNGRFVDDFDKVCHDYNNKFKCFNIDINNGAFGDFEQYNDCHYWTSYSWHMDQNNVPVCGPEANPEYQTSYNSWSNQPGRFEWNQCRLALCQAEREFAIGLAPFFENKNFKKQNAANYGLNDADQCTHLASDQERDVCCGDMVSYNRTPFDANYQCCQSGQLLDLAEC